MRFGVCYNIRMFHIEDVLHLGERERLLGVVRRHPVVLVRRLFWPFLLIVVPFFFIFPLISWGAFGMVLFLFAVLFGTLFAIRAVLLWNAHVLIATTDRLVLVQEKGLFSRFVTDIALQDVRDVNWERRGMTDALFRLGTLRIRPSSEEQTIAFSRVSKPQEFCRVVQEARSPAIVRTHDTPSRVMTVEELMTCIDALPHGERRALFEKCGMGGSEDREPLPVITRDV